MPPKEPTPTEVLKSYFQASDNKDVAAVKQTFSKATTKMYEGIAQKRQISVDEIVKTQIELASGSKLMSKIEIVSEKVDGDVALIEAKDNTTGNLEKISFVREDGGWKIAFDKLIDDVLKKETEQMKIPIAAPDLDAAKPDGDAKSKTNSSKPKTDK